MTAGSGSKTWESLVGKKQAGGNPDEMQETCWRREPSRQWQTDTRHVLAHASAEGRGRVRDTRRFAVIGASTEHFSTDAAQRC